MDQGTLQELVAIMPRLRRFAIGLAGNREDAEDLVQSACARAIERIDQWQAGTRLDSWMYKMVQNIFIDSYRAEKVRKNYQQEASHFQVVPSDGRQVVESRQTLDKVRQHVGDLPADQRTVLLLVCVEGRSYREVAEITSTPIGTVMSRLSRARLFLQNSLNQGANDDYEEL